LLRVGITDFKKMQRPDSYRALRQRSGILVLYRHERLPGEKAMDTTQAGEPWDVGTF
jgi:hypothetical protein